MEEKQLAILMTLGMYAIPLIILISVKQTWIKILLITLVSIWGYITNKSNIEELNKTRK